MSTSQLSLRPQLFNTRRIKYLLEYLAQTFNYFGLSRDIGDAMFSKIEFHKHLIISVPLFLRNILLYASFLIILLLLFFVTFIRLEEGTCP